jgi:hypothetical protein
LEEIVAAPVKKTENTTGGIRCADHATPSIRRSWYYFAKKRRWLGRHSSLADQSHGIFIFLFLVGISFDEDTYSTCLKKLPGATTGYNAKTAMRLRDSPKHSELDLDISCIVFCLCV